MDEWIIANGLTRREFVRASLMGTAPGFFLCRIPDGSVQRRHSPFNLPPLPYAEAAPGAGHLGRTISFHYGKHHRAYVDNLNGLVKNTPYEKIEPRGSRQGFGRGPRSGGRFQQRRTGLEITPFTGAA